jgi:hypothetical protein
VRAPTPLIALAVTVACGVGLVDAGHTRAGGGIPSRCLKAGERVIGESSKALLIKEHHRADRPHYYGCLRRKGARTRLDRHNYSVFRAYGQKGAFVATHYYPQSVSEEGEEYIRVWDLATGRVRIAWYAAPPRASFGSARLRPTGSVAFLEELGNGEPAVHVCPIASCYADGRSGKPTVVDQGEISTRSFQLKGDVLTWINAGTQKAFELA